LIKNEFKVAFYRKLSDKDVFEICHFLYDENQKLTMTSNFLEPIKGYELKEISIAKDQEIIVLLRDKLFMKSAEKSHCLLTSLDLSDLKKSVSIPFQESLFLKDDIQVLNRKKFWFLKYF